MYFIGPPFGNYINIPGLTPIKGSFTLNPRPGLLSQIFKTLRYNLNQQGWVNKIGLRNKGIEYAIKNYKKGEIISIAILNKTEIPQFIAKIPQDMNIELNVSCPNIEKDLETQGLKVFLNKKRKWCIVKLSPICDKRLIDKYYKNGFRQFHCSNTLPVINGGLSGRSLIPYNREIIEYLKSKYNDVEIIGGGGIRTWENIAEYKKMGANHFAISSVTFCPYLFIKLYMDMFKNKK